MIHQINISKGGLPKLAVPDAALTPLGLAGDVQRHDRIHGGLDKALLLISLEDIESLADEGYPVVPGGLGENLTIQGLNFRALRGGMRLEVGGAALELTKLRRPCTQLDVYSLDPEHPVQGAIFDDRCKAGDPTSPLWARGGFYARVLRPGYVKVGDPVVLLEAAV